MTINTYSKNDRTSIAKNFKVYEFACRGSGCCSTAVIDTKLVEYLQKIRDHFGKPVNVTSAYRCSKHNKTVGGVTGSYHTQGRAADIVVDGIAPAEVAKYAESLGIKGIGLYETDKDGHFVHIDTRSSKSFWYGQGQTYRSTFGGAPKDEPAYGTIGVKEWQKAAIADGFKPPKYFRKWGADGCWGDECIAVAKKAIVKRRVIHTNKNLTKLVQRALGFTGSDIDGKCGKMTSDRIVAYQRANGLTDDGEVGLDTWKKLLGMV